MSIIEKIKRMFSRNKISLLNASSENKIHNNDEYNHFSDELKKQVVSDDDRIRSENEKEKGRKQVFINISDAIIESFDNEDSSCINDSIEEYKDNLSSTEIYILKWIAKNSKDISSDVLGYFANNRKLDILVEHIEDDFSEKIPPEFRESKLALDTYLFERKAQEYISGIMQNDISAKDCY